MKIFYLGVMLFYTQLSLAGTGVDPFKPIPYTITISTNVQEKTNKLSSVDKKHAGEAIKVGAAFMKQYLDQMVCNMENPDWEGQVGGLVAAEWVNQTTCAEIRGQVVTGYGYDNDSLAVRELCSQALLIDIKFEHDSMYLTYEMTKVGAFIGIHEGRLIAFNSEGSGQKEKIVIALNADVKVYKMIPPDSNQERGYGWDLGNLVYPRYKELYKQFKQEIEQVCK